MSPARLKIPRTSVKQHFLVRYSKPPILIKLILKFHQMQLLNHFSMNLCRVVVTRCRIGIRNLTDCISVENLGSFAQLFHRHRAIRLNHHFILILSATSAHQRAGRFTTAHAVHGPAVVTTTAGRSPDVSTTLWSITSTPQTTGQNKRLTSAYCSTTVET